MAEVIKSFTGERAFLSNFATCSIFYEDIMYSSVEHAFQAAKSLSVDDRVMVASAATPGQAKKLGRKVTLREDWEQVKNSVMYQLLALKFSQGLSRAELFSTGEAVLIEGNTWHDQYWGSCTCTEHKDIMGRNQLGVNLMCLRADLRNRQR